MPVFTVQADETKTINQLIAEPIETPRDDIYTLVNNGVDTPNDSEYMWDYIDTGEFFNGSGDATGLRFDWSSSPVTVEDSVNSVIIRARIRDMGGTGINRIICRIRDDLTDLGGDTKTCGNAWANETFANVNWNIAWTPTLLETLTAFAVVTQSGKEVDCEWRISEVEVIVDYTVDGAVGAGRIMSKVAGVGGGLAASGGIAGLRGGLAG